MKLLQMSKGYINSIFKPKVLGTNSFLYFSQQVKLHIFRWFLYDMEISGAP